MRHWKYTLANGKYLRELIDGAVTKENAKAIMEQLLLSYRLIQHALGLDDEDYNIATQSLRYDIESECFSQDDANYNLGDFYDYCDANNVWVGIGF